MLKNNLQIKKYPVFSTLKITFFISIPRVLQQGLKAKATLVALINPSPQGALVQSSKEFPCALRSSRVFTVHFTQECPSMPTALLKQHSH